MPGRIDGKRCRATWLDARAASWKGVRQTAQDRYRTSPSAADGSTQTRAGGNGFATSADETAITQQVQNHVHRAGVVVMPLHMRALLVSKLDRGCADHRNAELIGATPSRNK